MQELQNVLIAKFTSLNLDHTDWSLTIQVAIWRTQNNGHPTGTSVVQGEAKRAGTFWAGDQKAFQGECKSQCM